MKHLTSIIVAILILSIAPPCPANPLSKILSIFKRDLAVTVEYADHQNLIPGSKVYWSNDPKGEKTLIGKVKNVSRTGAQNSQVDIIIDKSHKDKILESTFFVLMSGFFSDSSDTYIMAVSEGETSGGPRLKSGAKVAGVTFLEYKIATAGDEFKNMVDRLKKQQKGLQRQLQEYIDSFNTKEFQNKMDGLIDQLSDFSIEQKEHFKNDVLPSLKKAFDEMMEKLEEQNNTDKSKDLEKQFKAIEDLVNV